MKYFDRFLSAASIPVRHIHPVAVTRISLILLLAATSPAIAQDTTSGSTSSTGTTLSTGTALSTGLASSIAPGTSSRSSTSIARRPARQRFRAARLTYIEGNVRVELANSSANSIAALNMPLVEGTVISSGSNGQAEIEFEDGSVARLTPNSGLSLTNLSVDSSGNYQTRIALLGGLVYLELRGGTKYIYAVDAGGDVISPVENTTVRVNFDQAPAIVTILDGTAHFATAGKSFIDATAGQTVQVDPSSDGGVLLVKSAIAPESWDRWNEDRDQAAASESDTETDARTRFAGSQGYGWSDLDANGTWYDVPGHTEVWQPDIAAIQSGSADSTDQSGDQAAPEFDVDNSGFDPYGYGSWAWTPVGYSWASAYGWGWLPYRCGRWSYYPGFGWGWSPNLFCGTYGFAGIVYSEGYNFGVLPPNYKRPVRPIPGPGPVHPILRGHGGPVPVTPVHRPGGDRIIAGNTVHPLPPVSSGLTASTGNSRTNSPGAALRRDYPVNTTTHTSVIGLITPTHNAPVAGSNARAVWQERTAGTSGQVSGQPRSPYISTQATPRQPTVGQPNFGSNNTAPVARTAPVQRASPALAPRAAPPAPASHSTPAPASSSSTKGK